MTKLILIKKDRSALIIIDDSTPHLVSLFFKIMNIIKNTHRRMNTSIFLI